MLGSDFQSAWSKKPVKKPTRKKKVPIFSLKRLVQSANTVKIGLAVFFRKYCSNTSIHGFQYLMDRKLHWSERCVWTFLVCCGISGAVYLSLVLSEIYQSSILATVVESTIYPVSEIPFPAVTVCRSNQIDWKRAVEYKRLFVSDNDTKSSEIYWSIVVALNQRYVENFHQFRSLSKWNRADLRQFNLSNILQKIKPSCDSMFVGDCWWRNKFTSCCSLFFEQNTEQGLCFAFNSYHNTKGKERHIAEQNWPWRTSAFGDWTGLRMSLKTETGEEAHEFNDSRLAGFSIIVHHPMEWPSAGQFVGIGTTTSVIIDPTYFYATDDVLRLSPSKRMCLSSNELPQNEVQYLMTNCFSECRQRYLLTLCNCTVHLMFPPGFANNASICDAEGLICLSAHDNINHFENYFTSHITNGNDRKCSCLPECDRINYATEISSIALSDSDQQIILVDVHFSLSTLVKYRTFVPFTWLDLVVSFGGIAGLFVGSSLISIAEIFYYCSYGLVAHLLWSVNQAIQMLPMRTSQLKQQNAWEFVRHRNMFK